MVVYTRVLTLLYHRKKTGSNVVIGKPTNIVHKAHVGFDGTQWSSEPTSAAKLLRLIYSGLLCVDCVATYMCVYVCTCVYMSVCVSVCLCLHACMCVHTRVYVYSVCVCVCVCVYVCTVTMHSTDVV